MLSSIQVCLPYVHRELYTVRDVMENDPPKHYPSFMFPFVV